MSRRRHDLLQHIHVRFGRGLIDPSIEARVAVSERVRFDIPSKRRQNSVCVLSTLGRRRAKILRGERGWKGPKDRLSARLRSRLVPIDVSFMDENLPARDDGSASVCIGPAVT
jgi:hypothetical protein